MIESPFFFRLEKLKLLSKKSQRQFLRTNHKNRHHHNQLRRCQRVVFQKKALIFIKRIQHSQRLSNRSLTDSWPFNNWFKWKLLSLLEIVSNKFLFVQKLRSVGLNVFPEPDSESYVSVINKVRWEKKISFVRIESKRLLFFSRIINSNGSSIIKWRWPLQRSRFLTVIGTPSSMTKWKSLSVAKNI